MTGLITATPIEVAVTLTVIVTVIDHCMKFRKYKTQKKTHTEH